MGVVCPACALPVTAGQVHALGKVWHPKCFVCKKCGKELRSEQFKLVDGKPYCDLCVHRQPDLIKKTRAQSGKTASGKAVSGAASPSSSSSLSPSDRDSAGVGNSGGSSGSRGGGRGSGSGGDDNPYGPYGGWKKGDPCVIA